MSSPPTGGGKPRPPERFSGAPEVVRGIYLSFWSAALRGRVDGLIDLAREGAANAVAVDLKDIQGRVGFDTRVAEAIAFRARNPIIRDLRSLVSRLQEAGLYVIARIVVFTDPELARARPELAVHSKSKLARDGAGLSAATLWADSRNLNWDHPGAKPVWDYNIAIARDALSAGVDEVDFDYIRLPSEGTCGTCIFPSPGAGPRGGR